MLNVRIGPEPFDVAHELAHLLATGAEIGGIGAFIGVVRGGEGPEALSCLTLEHYPSMTLKTVRRIAADAVERWNLLGCTVIHRVGPLRPGEPIVLVLAASRHRQPALDATSFLIDWLKTKAPFWKSETRLDGTDRWVEARAEDDEAAARWEQSRA